MLIPILSFADVFLQKEGHQKIKYLLPIIFRDFFIIMVKNFIFMLVFA